jgi:hypothetical protein
MPADLNRKDGCIFCGGAEAVVPVRRLTPDGGIRYAHPSCVAAELRRDPADSVAGSCAAQFGMRRELKKAQAAADAATSSR